MRAWAWAWYTQIAGLAGPRIPGVAQAMSFRSCKRMQDAVSCPEGGTKRQQTALSRYKCSRCETRVNWSASLSLGSLQRKARRKYVCIKRCLVVCVLGVRRAAVSLGSQKTQITDHPNHGQMIPSGLSVEGYAWSQLPRCLAKTRRAFDAQPSVMEKGLQGYQFLTKPCSSRRYRMSFGKCWI